MTRHLRPLGLLGLLVLPALLPARSAVAQTTVAVTGTAVDADDSGPLPGLTVVATRLTADSLRTAALTDAAGSFRLPLAAGRYRLRLSFVGYASATQTVEVAAAPVALGTIRMAPDPLALGEAVVEATQERVSVRGDTTVYNASAFQTNPDATAEDLIAKLPGVVVEDGAVTAQGETVQRVLVDGEEFFGTDPAATLRNLPAEIIASVEVYDRASDQARFTGFDDGQAERTINVVTRPDRRNGQFGRVFGGGGTDERYLAGGAVNLFNGARRITVIGLANNVNQQNFGTEDLLGVLGAASGRQGGGRGGRGGGGGPRGGGGGPRGGGPGGGDDGGPPGGGPGGSDPRNYLVGEQGGLNTTTALGVNYIDRWGPRVRVNGSYFVNGTGNDTDRITERAYADEVADLLYTETNQSESQDLNHRFNLRINAELSDATEFTLTPRLSVQHNTVESLLTGRSAFENGLALSATDNDYTSDGLGFTSATNASLRHRFATRGRTVSVNASVGFDGRRADTDQAVTSLFYDSSGSADSTDTFQRQIGSDGWSRTLSATLAYTEPLSERLGLQFSYSPSASRRVADQDAFRLDAASGTFTVLDSTLTSTSDQHVDAHRGGVSLRYRGERVSGSVGLDAQTEGVSYEQGGPLPFSVERRYGSVLPSAQLRLNIAEGASADVSVRSSTSAPGVTQLRTTVDDSNPLYVTTGNPDLRSSTAQSLDGRFRLVRGGSGESLTASANVSTVQNYIATASVIAGADSLTVEGVTLAPGAQLSRPVNLDGYLSARSSVTYGRPIGFLRSNASLSTGASYTRTPGLIAGVLNRSNALALDARLGLSSNVSERLDFNLSYGASYTTVTNTSDLGEDGDYVRHRASGRLTWQPPGGFVLTSDLNLSVYSGLSSSVNPTSALWNVGVGYKFLRNDLAEVRLTVTDLLDQNRNVNRTVNGLYVEDSQTEALGRYVMLNFSYRLRQFGR